MDKEDARKQTLEQLHERRKQVVRLRNKGHKVMQIVEMTGLTYPTVRGPLICLFKEAGLLLGRRREGGQKVKNVC